MALLGALLLGLSALVATQNWPAERAAKWMLAANGVHAERLEIESWGLGHVSLRHLTIHQPVALTAEQVRVDWQIGAENPIQSIRVQTLEVHLPKPSPDSAAPRPP